MSLISGCCSLDYSYGIIGPHEDIEKTGLNIWDERVNIAQDCYNRFPILFRLKVSDTLLHEL